MISHLMGGGGGGQFLSDDLVYPDVWGISNLETDGKSSDGGQLLSDDLARLAKDRSIWVLTGQWSILVLTGQYWSIPVDWSIEILVVR